MVLSDTTKAFARWLSRASDGRTVAVRRSSSVPTGARAPVGEREALEAKMGEWWRNAGVPANN
ncbi:hypothetical protein [Halopiger goleimassiliensis]|uniref:hypothetical protein n=1 Tax=Halopiger goleimassiliensis TaxID=1293048 RepID=UPI000A56AE9E|nr:hypothetical protein [Halopiger goleimassiliensis]